MRFFPSQLRIHRRDRPKEQIRVFHLVFRCVCVSVYSRDAFIVERQHELNGRRWQMATIIIIIMNIHRNHWIIDTDFAFHWTKTKPRTSNNMCIRLTIYVPPQPKICSAAVSQSITFNHISFIIPNFRQSHSKRKTKERITSCFWLVVFDFGAEHRCLTTQQREKESEKEICMNEITRERLPTL